MPLENDEIEIVVILEPIVGEVLDKREYDIVVPQVEIINLSQRVSFTHDIVDEIVRRERVRSATPAAYEGISSAQCSKILWRFKYIRNPPSCHMNSCENEFQDPPPDGVLQFTTVGIEDNGHLTSMRKRIDDIIIDTELDMCLTQLSAKRVLKRTGRVQFSRFKMNLHYLTSKCDFPA